MPKRHRVRARPRRPFEQRAELPRDDRSARPRARGAPPPLTPAMAVGEPSPTLERAATLEHDFVLRDARKLAVVIVVMLVLLAVGGVAADAFLP